MRPSRASSGMGQVCSCSSSTSACRRPSARSAVWMTRSRCAACQATVTCPFGSPACNAASSLAIGFVGEVFAAAQQQSPDLEQRVVGVAAVTEGLLLDSAADLVHGGVAELDDVERVQHHGWRAADGCARRWRNRGTGPRAAKPIRFRRACPRSPINPTGASFHHLQHPRWPPGVRSTTTAAYPVRRRGPACCHTCSSTPRPVIPSSRSVSSTSDVP